MPRMKTVLKHLKLAVSEIEKMPEPVKPEKKAKTKSIGTSPMKEPKAPKAVKTKSMGTSTAGLEKSMLKNKNVKSKDSPTYNI